MALFSACLRSERCCDRARAKLPFMWAVSDVAVSSVAVTVDLWLTLLRPSRYRITSVAYFAIVFPTSAKSRRPCSLTGSLLRSRKYST